MSVIDPNGGEGRGLGNAGASRNRYEASGRNAWRGVLSETGDASGKLANLGIDRYTPSLPQAPKNPKVAEAKKDGGKEKS